MEHIRGPRIPDHDLSSKAHCFVSNSKERGGLVVRFLIPFEGEDLFCLITWKQDFLEDRKQSEHVGLAPDPLKIFGRLADRMELGPRPRSFCLLYI